MLSILTFYVLLLVRSIYIFTDLTLYTIIWKLSTYKNVKTLYQFLSLRKYLYYINFEMCIWYNSKIEENRLREINLGKTICNIDWYILINMPLIQYIFSIQCVPCKRNIVYIQFYITHILHTICTIQSSTVRIQRHRIYKKIKVFA